jgi:hypothetical protein
MAPSNAHTVDEIINSFISPVIPKVKYGPTFEGIQVKTRLLNVNAISVPSMAGEGDPGHLGIIMTQVDYAAISATPWVEPLNYGSIPVFPLDTNAVYAAQTTRMHDECCRIYTNRIHVDPALKRIMLEAYDNMHPN